jgi:hypothetical protein
MTSCLEPCVKSVWSLSFKNPKGCFTFVQIHLIDVLQMLIQGIIRITGKIDSPAFCSTYACISTDTLWMTGWWFGTFFIFPYIGNVIIPTDFHIFQRGWNHQPVYDPYTMTHFSIHVLVGYLSLSYWHQFTALEFLLTSHRLTFAFRYRWW